MKTSNTGRPDRWQQVVVIALDDIHLMSLTPGRLPVQALKSSVILCGKAYKTVAEIGEVLDDLVAEARTELKDRSVSN